MLDEFDALPDLREAVRALRARFPAAYFRETDQAGEYPDAYVRALIEAGWLAALIPQDYGGAGLGLTEASVIMEEINRCAGNAGACRGQTYNIGTLLRHGSPAQKAPWLPEIAAGRLCLQSMGVTEPEAGTDTTSIRTTAVRKGDSWVVHGQKVWISRVRHSDLTILLARTTPLAEVVRKGDGLSLFLANLREAVGHGTRSGRIPNMGSRDSCELFLDGLEIPAQNLIGTEGQGFRHVLDGLNAARAPIAAECTN